MSAIWHITFAALSMFMLFIALSYSEPTSESILQVNFTSSPTLCNFCNHTQLVLPTIPDYYAAMYIVTKLEALVRVRYRKEFRTWSHELGCCLD